MARTPRILILSSEYSPVRGGIGTYARELGVAAANLGAEVVLYAPDYHGRAAADEFDGALRVNRYKSGKHYFGHLPDKFHLTRATTFKTPFDIIHAVDWPFYIPVSTLPRQQAPIRLATLHGTEINLMARPKRKFLLDTFGIMPRFDGLLCNSRFTQDLYRRHFGNRLDHSRIALLGVSHFWHDADLDKTAARACMNFQSGDLIIITVGRLTRRKGHLTALRALSRLDESLRKKLVWVIVGPDGENDYISELNAKLENAPFRTRKFADLHEEDLRKLYKCADLFCLTGSPDKEKVEGFGLVFLEAGAAGLPSLATRTGGVEDAVIHGKTGLIVEVDAVDDLTSATERLLLDHELRGRLSTAARDYAKDLTWERCARETYLL